MLRPTTYIASSSVVAMEALAGSGRYGAATASVWARVICMDFAAWSAGSLIDVTGKAKGNLHTECARPRHQALELARFAAVRAPDQHQALDHGSEQRGPTAHLGRARLRCELGDAFAQLGD